MDCPDQEQRSSGSYLIAPRFDDSSSSEGSSDDDIDFFGGKALFISAGNSSQNPHVGEMVCAAGEEFIKQDSTLGYDRGRTLDPVCRTSEASVPKILEECDGSELGKLNCANDTSRHIENQSQKLKLDDLLPEPFGKRGEKQNGKSKHFSNTKTTPGTNSARAATYPTIISSELGSNEKPFRRTISNPYKTSNAISCNSQEYNDESRSEKPLCTKECQPQSGGNEHRKRNPGIHQPLPYIARPDPIVHQLNPQNRPLSSRVMIPVGNIFRPPILDFWQTKFHSFNYMQSEIANAIAHSDDNIVVAAPTGAGKTALFEMAMGRLFASSLKVTGSSISSGGEKIVYIAPAKALCEERFTDWSQRLASLDVGISCAMVTGDSSPYEAFRQVESATLILTTPEKWDGITRKWSENLHLIASVKLLLIDEIHMLGDTSRGGTLEAIICRMKTVQRAAQSWKSSSVDSRGKSSTNVAIQACSMRVVAVSATLPNIVDIASFVGANEAYYFDESYRPVPLTVHVLGLGYMGKNHYIFQKSLDRHVPEQLRRYSNGRPSIVFCHSKKETESLALNLASLESGSSSVDGPNTRIASQVTVASLQRCIRSGVAYHHAGLIASDRKIVEQAFANGLVRYLCATSTLAMGVNLPSHLVVVKGTSAWRGAGQGLQDIDSGSLLQMIGRAGRPGFDTTGTAVIMTDSASKKRLEKLSSGLELVESQLLGKLVETLNTEISQRVINNTEQAIDWLKGTFFYRRVRKNPVLYGMQGKTEQQMDSYLLDRCVNSLRELHEVGIIELHDNGSSIIPLKASHVMSSNMVDFAVMKRISELPHDGGGENLIHMLSECEGLHRPVRRSEKKYLNDAHRIIKYKLPGPPSKVRIQTPKEKTFVLLQCSIGQHFIEEYTLRQEMSSMVDYATRMLVATEAYSVEHTRHGKLALACLLMRRSLATSLWGTGDGVLNQVKGIGQKTTAKLRMNKINSFADVLSNSCQFIEETSGRSQPFGQELRSAVTRILQNSVALSAYVESPETSNASANIVCKLERNANVKGVVGVTGSEQKSDESIVKYTLFVYTDRPGGILLFKKDVAGSSEHRLACPAKYGRLYIRLVASLIGLDEKVEICGNVKMMSPTGSRSPFNTKDLAVSPNNGRSKSQRTLESSFQKMVEGNRDVRLKKNPSSRGMSPKKGVTSGISNITGQQATTPASIEQSNHVKITPSPKVLVPPVKSRLSAGESTNYSSQSTLENFRPDSLVSTEKSRDKKRARSDRGVATWQHQNREQRVLQQRAFHSPKQNPFSSFQFDPNDCESILDKRVNETKQVQANSSSLSVIPALVQPRQLNTDNRSRFWTSRKSFRSARKAGVRKGVSPALPRVRNHELLGMKANELQTYSEVSQNSSRSSTHPNYHNNRLHAEYGNANRYQSLQPSGLVNSQIYRQNAEGSYRYGITETVDSLHYRNESTRNIPDERMVNYSDERSNMDSYQDFENYHQPSPSHYPYAAPLFTSNAGHLPYSEQDGQCPINIQIDARRSGFDTSYEHLEDTMVSPYGQVQDPFHSSPPTYEYNVMATPQQQVNTHDTRHHPDVLPDQASNPLEQQDCHETDYKMLDDAFF